jgi:hypothetical protein
MVVESFGRKEEKNEEVRLEFVRLGPVAVPKRVAQQFYWLAADAPASQR